MSEVGKAAADLGDASVPDALLVPLLDAAADVLRALDAEEVPAGLRTLAGFDRRGLSSATARHQLRRAFDLDDDFRARVVEDFTARPEVRAVLAGWDPDEAVSRADDAAERDDLGLLVAALYAARPVGFAFGLGVACAEDRQRRAARTLHDDARAQSAQLATMEEAVRRADEALAAARAEVARLEGELREERRGRRDREASADRRAAEAERRIREAEAAVDKARREGELAETRARREADRAREAERRLRELKRELEPRPQRPSPGSDAAALADVARRARELADALGALVEPPPRPDGGPSAVEHAAAEAPAAASGPGRRAAVPCPPGLRSDQPEALDAMLRTRGVVLVVDGYNVSMAGWPDHAVAVQRDRLIAALERLHLRLRCDVVVVFDGADVEGVTPRRTPGVRVVFSAPGEPADPVVIREVASLPLRVPVLVVSSDRWVRERAAGEGATPVTADVLVAVLRR